MFSCDNKTQRETKNSGPITLVTNSDSLLTIDTTITLTDIIRSNYHGNNLTDIIAKRTLYKYFHNKGYLNVDNLPTPEKLTDADDDRLCVDFNNIFLVELNGNTNQDAIITYWLTPPYANGNCWQTHKAIILDTDNGYKITNEEFISDNFAIDSVLNQDGQITVYGYDYDCENHKVLKHIRARIK
jgi:hypothetical protein